MGANSDVQICNLALTLLGADRITSLTQDIKEARACNAMFANVRDDVLADHIWNFASKRANLAVVTGDPVFTDDGVTIIYQLPTDFIRLTHVNFRGALVKIEGDKLLSNTALLAIKYIFRETDTQKYSSKFVLALATRLAADLAFEITASRSLEAQKLLEYHDKRLPQAITVDSQQGTPRVPMQSDILFSRLHGGSSDIVGQTGWDTWSPVCF
ncbi:hypothetical protein LCGC14_2702230 [marine sediment metagenome]|uniref:Uncharacterized protein n=1 Tax=marine sediment metagenome TaxID=412755 RepID=A0A0F9BPQ1_9ZZZZ